MTPTDQLAADIMRAAGTCDVDRPRTIPPWRDGDSGGPLQEEGEPTAARTWRDEEDNGA